MSNFALISFAAISAFGFLTPAQAANKGTIYLSASKFEFKMVQQGSASSSFRSSAEVTPFLAVPASTSVDETMSALAPSADDMAYGCQASYRWNNLTNEAGGVSFVMIYQISGCAPIRIKDIPNGK